jgi:hypothetical protein
MPLVQDFMPLHVGFDAGLTHLLSRALDEEPIPRLGLDRLVDARVDTLGPARFHDEVLVVPLVFVGDGAPFDRLEADLRLQRVADRRSHLTLIGSYATSALSRREGIVRHLLTESWARALLTNLASSLERREEDGVSP